MRTWRGFSVAVLLTVTHLAAQRGVGLQVEGATPEFAADLVACRDRLAAAAPADAEERAHLVLGHLRLGALAAARDLLRAAVGMPDPKAAAWNVVAHHWYLRATDDLPPIRRHLPALRDGLLGAARTPMATDATFADAALIVHANFCLGDLMAATDSTGAGLETTRIATALWLELERQVWQPGRGHFRGRPTRGRIVLPEAADATVLAPAAAGLLIASGDRMQRHLETSLRALLPLPGNDRCASAWLLAAAAQVGDRPLLLAAWRQATGPAPGGEAVSGADAGRRLDALLFAITGQRVATGAGSDARCVRLRPWLPPGHDRLDLRGILAHGRTFDLSFAQREGPLQPDERDEIPVLGAQPGARLRVRVRLEPTTATRACAFVIQGDTLQYVVALHGDEAFARSLPLRRP